MFERNHLHFFFLFLIFVIRSAWTTDIATKEYYLTKDLKPVLRFPSTDEIKQALNARKTQQTSTKRWIKKGKYKFLMQLAYGNMCEKCDNKLMNFCKTCQKRCTKKSYVDFPANFPNGAFVCGVRMIKKPYLFFSTTKEYKKEWSQDYEYIWQGENYAMIAPFLCEFSNNTARQYTIKINIRLHRHGSKNIIANIIQRKNSLETNDVWLVSSHPNVDGNFIFSGTTKNEIESMLEENGAKVNPEKQVWCLSESAWVKGGLVVQYYAPSSRYNGFSQECYILDKYRKNWLLSNQQNASEEFTKQYASNWKLSAHIEDLYDVLEKNGFNRKGQILPPIEDGFYFREDGDFIHFFDGVIKDLTASLGYLNQHIEKIRINGVEIFSDVSKLLILCLDRAEKALKNCSENHLRLADYFDQDISLVLEDLTNINLAMMTIEYDQNLLPTDHEGNIYLDDKLVTPYLVSLEYKSIILLQALFRFVTLLHKHQELHAKQHGFILDS